MNNITELSVPSNTTLSTTTKRNWLDDGYYHFNRHVMPMAYRASFYTTVIFAGIGLILNFLAAVVFLKSRMSRSAVGKRCELVSPSTSRFCGSHVWGTA